MTWVAPRDLRRASLCGEAVAMMGENLESLATWMAVCAVGFSVCVYDTWGSKGIENNAPYWPTEEEPPRMKAGLPAYLVSPPSSYGATKLADFASG